MDPIASRPVSGPYCIQTIYPMAAGPSARPPRSATDIICNATLMTRSHCSRLLVWPGVRQGPRPPIAHTRWFPLCVTRNGSHCWGTRWFHAPLGAAKGRERRIEQTNEPPSATMATFILWDLEEVSIRSWGRMVGTSIDSVYLPGLVPREIPGPTLNATPL